MIPWEFRPAATNSPGTSGSGQSWKFASGVNDSGARRKCSNPSPSSRDPAPRLREHRGDVVPVRAELGEPAGRDAGGRERPAVRLERADHEPAAVVANVQEPVEVADERLRLDRERRLLGHHPHVLGGHQRDAAAGEARQLRRPQARREDHGLRVDVPTQVAIPVTSPRSPRRKPVTVVPDVPDAAVDGALREAAPRTRIDRAVARYRSRDEVVDRLRP
jgi:hypothetical protein